MESSSPILDEVLRDFDEHRRWPKDVADLVASCGPSDELLLELIRRDSVRHQSLALHVIGQLVERVPTVSLERVPTVSLERVPTVSPGSAVAKEVLRLLESEAFRPKGKSLRDLKAWAKGN